MARKSQTFPRVPPPLAGTPGTAQDGGAGTRAGLPGSTPGRVCPWPRPQPPAQAARLGEPHWGFASATARPAPHKSQRRIPLDLQPLHPPVTPWLNTALKSCQRQQRPGHPPALSGIRWSHLMLGLNHLCGNCSSLFRFLSGEDGGGSMRAGLRSRHRCFESINSPQRRMGCVRQLPETLGKPAAGPRMKVTGRCRCTKPGVGKLAAAGGTAGRVGVAPTWPGSVLPGARAMSPFIPQAPCLPPARSHSSSPNARACQRCPDWMGFRGTHRCPARGGTAMGRSPGG